MELFNTSMVFPPSNNSFFTIKDLLTLFTAVRALSLDDSTSKLNVTFETRSTTPTTADREYRVISTEEEEKYINAFERYLQKKVDIERLRVVELSTKRKTITLIQFFKDGDWINLSDK